MSMTRLRQIITLASVFLSVSRCFPGEPAEKNRFQHAWPDGFPWAIQVLKDRLPDTIRVPEDYPTIQDGIGAALSGDTVLVSPGTYYENIDFLGKGIVVTSVRGPDSTVIDGCGLGSVVTAATGEPVGTEISGFTIRNGNNEIKYGGGVFCGSSSCINVINNVIEYNYARYGGGVGVKGSSAIVSMNIFQSNDADNYGGGVYGIGARVRINKNHLLNSNKEGIYCIDSDASIIGNYISGNGVECYSGGGIYIYDSKKSRVISNIIIWNEAYKSGGCYFVSADSIFFENNLVSFNTDYQGIAGIFIGYLEYFRLTNNIIAFGFNGDGINNYGYVNEYIIEYNDVYGNDGFDYFNVEPGIGNISFDPLLYDESKLDWRSPCIDMGDPTMEPPAGGGDRVDIGASEFPFDIDPPVLVEGLSIPDTVDTGSSADWRFTLVNMTASRRYVECFVSFMKADANLPVFHGGFNLDPFETFVLKESYDFGEFFHAGGWEIMARAGLPDSTLYDLDRKGFTVFREPRLIDVPGDFSAIQPAIEASVDGDTILVSAGTYEEAIDYLGKSIALVSASGLDSTTLICNEEQYAVMCKDSDGGRGRLAGFTVTRDGSRINFGLMCEDFDLNVDECRFNNWQRAIACRGSSHVKLEGCDIRNNSTGILIEDDVVLEVTGCDVIAQYNIDGFFGGGLGCLNDAVCLIRNSRLNNNVNYSEYGWGSGTGGGLALDNYSYCRVESSELICNTADIGGGVYMRDHSALDISNSIINGNGNRGFDIWGGCAVDIRNCFINNNGGSNSGGGISFIAGLGSYIVLENSEIRGNSVTPGYMSWYGSGGGMDLSTVANSIVMIEHCRVCNNTVRGGQDANHTGGGLYKSGEGDFLISNSEISDNRLGRIYGSGYNQGAGAYIRNGIVKNCVIHGNYIDDGAGSGGGLRLADSVVAGNLVIRENIPDQIYVYNQGPTIEFSNIQDGWPGEGNIDADPLFVSPEEEHFSLMAGSPCIDTGDPDLSDPDGTRSDMGAYGGPGAKPVNMTLPETAFVISPGDTLEFEILLTNSTDTPLNVTVHAILRSRADLADVRLLGNGGMSLAANASRRVTASGVVSPALEPGYYFIHLYLVNDLQNDPIEFSNINLEVTS